ncbi:MAG: cell division protein SepF [Acidimicrobiia bacterium]|nr:cell division protein SepF [Acidimicrobiia bacterium]
MASLWQKTLFYLGLVDEDQTDSGDDGHIPASQTQVRTVEPLRRRQPAAAAAGTTASTRQTGVAGRRIEPPEAARRRISSEPQHAEAGVLVTRVDSDGPKSSSSASQVINARAFSDAQKLADHIRQGRAVVLDLRGTEPAMVRRLVDFSSGLTYALDGKMAKIAQGVILVTPAGKMIDGAEQRRLADMGLYGSGR